MGLVPSRSAHSSPCHFAIVVVQPKNFILRFNQFLIAWVSSSIFISLSLFGFTQNSETQFFFLVLTGTLRAHIYQNSRGVAREKSERKKREKLQGKRKFFMLENSFSLTPSILLKHNQQLSEREREIFIDFPPFPSLHGAFSSVLETFPLTERCLMLSGTGSFSLCYCNT